MSNIYYLETGSQNPYYNLAFEEYVLTHRTSGTYLMLWQNDNTIVVGQNQNTEAEINHEFVKAHHINVIRRATGGGAVYHDLGNLNYSFIADIEKYNRDTVKLLASPIVTALRELGLDAELSGRNDILVDGKKISGTAQRIYSGRVLLHGTLLFQSDVSMISGALRVDPEKFRFKAVKSVRSRVGNIRDALSDPMDMSAFWTYLKTHLFGGILQPTSLEPEELREVEALQKQKYETYEWNYGQASDFTFRNKRYWSNGSLEAALKVKNGTIEQIAFYGDFLSCCPISGIEEAMRGVQYRSEVIQKILAEQDIPRCFGGISAGEVLATIFDLSGNDL